MFIWVCGQAPPSCGIFAFLNIWFDVFLTENKLKLTSCGQASRPTGSQMFGRSSRSRHSFTSLHDLYVQLFSYLMPIGQQPGIFRPTSNLQFMAQSNYSNIVTAGFWWLINPTWGWTSTYYTISFGNEHPVSSYLIGYWSGWRGAITPTYNIQPMSLLNPGSNPKLRVCNFSDIVSAPWFQCLIRDGACQIKTWLINPIDYDYSSIDHKP